MRAWVVAVVILLSTGCANTPIEVLKEQLFHDDLFSPKEDSVIETEQQIFALSDDAKQFIDQQIRIYRDPQKQVQQLASAMFNKAQLSLSYAADANSIAADTFSSQQANCLSMTILTYALATYAGMDVDFYEVLIPEYWIRREGQSFLNGHVNLVIKPKNSSIVNAVQFAASGVQVDFGGDRSQKGFHKRRVNKQRIVAMYYNNRGADALLQQNYALAYQYFRQALQVDTGFFPALSNLGIVYRLTGNLQNAETVYRYILQHDRDNLNVLENLAVVKMFENKPAEAGSIYRRLQNKRQSNPYYHFIRGVEEYENGHWSQAIKHYERAIRLNRNVHEFYFGLAKAWYHLGDIERSEEYLRKAKIKSFDPDLEYKYQSKLDLLSRL